MIFSDSRYATGKIFKAFNPSNRQYGVTVFRVFPSEKTDYFTYVWKESDRIDLVSKNFLGTSALWWKIMDYNPEVLNPFNISAGTILRIPNVR